MKTDVRNDIKLLSIHGLVWEYKIGRDTVTIFSPENKKYYPRFWQIVGEEAYKKNNYSLNTAFIKEYILENILKDAGEKQCKYCRQYKPDVILRCNPYLAEIEHVFDKFLICNDCCSHLAEEV